MFPGIREPLNRLVEVSITQKKRKGCSIPGHFFYCVSSWVAGETRPPQKTPVARSRPNISCRRQLQYHFSLCASPSSTQVGLDWYHLNKCPPNEIATFLACSKPVTISSRATPIARAKAVAEVAFCTLCSPAKEG